MADWSRRRALQAVAGTGAVALAGCRGTTTGTRELPRAPREHITDIEAIKARNTDGRPLIRTGDTETAQDDVDLRQQVSAVYHLTDDADLEQLRFQAGADTRELRAFLTTTDFASRSVYLHQRPVAECYITRLVGVFRRGGDIEAQFCQVLRPADVACDSDAQDVIAVAIRLPFPGDEIVDVGTDYQRECDPFSTVSIRDGGDGS